MSDIVERLRNLIKQLHEGVTPDKLVNALVAMDKAADEIERLRVQNAALSIDHAEMVNELRTIRAATIEECARVADRGRMGSLTPEQVVAAIRALKEQK